VALACDLRCAAEREILGRLHRIGAFLFRVPDYVLAAT